MTAKEVREGLIWMWMHIYKQDWRLMLDDFEDRLKRIPLRPKWHVIKSDIDVVKEMAGDELD